MATEFDELVFAIRAVVDQREDWRTTARLVAEALERNLPSPDILTPEQQIGDPEGYRSHLLHVEPDGTFSIVALVWRPGQVTPIHDHVTWCVFGVVKGVEHEELFRLDEDRVQFVRGFGLDERFHAISLGEGVVGKAARDRRAVETADILRDPDIELTPATRRRLESQ